MAHAMAMLPKQTFAELASSSPRDSGALSAAWILPTYARWPGGTNGGPKIPIAFTHTSMAERDRASAGAYHAIFGRSATSLHRALLSHQHHARAISCLYHCLALP